MMIKKVIALLLPDYIIRAGAERLKFLSRHGVLFMFVTMRFFVEIMTMWKGWKLDEEYIYWDSIIIVFILSGTGLTSIAEILNNVKNGKRKNT